MKSFKDLSWKLKKELEEQGFEIPITTVLASLSKSVGYTCYEQLKVKPEEQVMSKITETYATSYPLNGGVREVESKGANHYEVTVSAAAVLTKSLGIQASSPQEARDRAMKYVEDNENYCGDSGEGWSFDHLGYGRFTCVTEVTHYLDEGGSFSNSVQLAPDWDLSVYSSEHELNKDFEKQVNSFLPLKLQQREVAYKMLNPTSSTSLQDIISGLRSLEKEDIDFIRNEIGMSFYDFLSKRYDFASRNQESWKKSFDFVKSLDGVTGSTLVEVVLIEEHPMEGASVLKTFRGELSECELEAAKFLAVEREYIDCIPKLRENLVIGNTEKVLDMVNDFEENGSDRFFKIQQV